MFLDNHVKGPWKTLSYKFIMVVNTNHLIGGVLWSIL
jgi:hypothetical protein